MEMSKVRKKADEVNATNILEAVKGLKPEDVVNQIGELQMKLQGTLAGLSAAIAGKIEQMQKVDEAIIIKAQELRELHDIDAMATTIEDMARQQSEKSETWNKSVEDQRAAWKEEQAERMKKWQREQEEYEYALTQTLKKKKDEIDAAISQAQRAESNRQQDLAKQWQIREDAIAAKEKEIVDLNNEVAGFDERIKSEVTRAEKITENSIKRHFEHQMELLNKDAEAKEKLYDSEMRSLRSTIDGLQKEMNKLQTALEAARMDAKEVTSKALESASGRQVAEALQKVVDSAPSSSKSK
jgi:chromosome segregation ATPase